MPSCAVFHRGGYLGFTLLELMITIIIMGIVASIAVPNVLNQLKQSESQRIAMTLSTFLSTAKQDAMIYQNMITICIANEQDRCVATNGTVLLSFVDKNGNHMFDNGTDIIKERTPLMLKYGTVRLNIALNKPYIDFKPSNGNPIGHMGNIRYCANDNNADNSFKVTFNQTGMVKIKSRQEEPNGC